MRTMIQRAISMLLVAVLLVSYVPTYGFADGASEESYIASNGEVGENSAMDGIVANTSEEEPPEEAIPEAGPAEGAEETDELVAEWSSEN